MHVLYQVANEKTAIKSRDGCAYLRILGFFPSKYHAMRHLKIIGDDFEVRIAETDKWRLILNCAFDDTTNEKESNKYEVLLKMHNQTNAAQIEEVTHNSETKVPGELATSSFFDRAATAETIVAETNDVVSNIAQNGIPKLPGQNYAVLVIVPDYENICAYQAKLSALVPEAEEAFTKARNDKYHETKNMLEMPNKADFLKQWSIQKDTTEICGDEPMFQFLGSFETEDAAREFLQRLNDASVLKEYTKACVSMYEFIKMRHVQHVNVPRTYQDPKLQQLMDALVKAKKLADVTN